MPNVKTVKLTGEEVAVTFGDSCPYYMIFNMGDSEIYASGNPDIVPYADGVYAVPAGVEIRISPERSGDTVYLFGSGTVQVRAETIAVQTSFKPSAKGGEKPSGTGEHYAFAVNQNVSVPGSMITYPTGYDNSDFTPAYMNYTTGEFDYGSWGDAFFLKKLKVVMLNFDGTEAYEIDPNDYTKKKDGTDVGTEGNVMGLLHARE